MQKLINSILCLFGWHKWHKLDIPDDDRDKRWCPMCYKQQTRGRVLGSGGPSDWWRDVA